MSINKKNLKKFAQQAKDYAKASYWRNDEKYLVEKYFKNPQNKKLLVLGCGGGRTLKPLYEYGFDITAIDIVPEMVEASKRRIGDLPIKVLEMDATDLKFKDNSFDYVFFPFHGFDNVAGELDKFLSEVSRILTDKGVLIFNSHNRWFLKKIHLFLKRYAMYNGFIQYRSTPFDYFKFKKYFKKVEFKYRITMQNSNQMNWKDKCYKLFPFFDRSIYFICQHPYDN